MQWVVLWSYIKDGLFLSDMNIEKNYDVLLIESSKHSVDVSSFEHSDIPVIFLDEEIEKWVSLSGVLTHYFEMYKKPLVILDQASIDSIFGLLRMLSLDVTIINLNVGLSGFGSKMRPSLIDISHMVDYCFDVYEPYDLASFLLVMQQKWRKYLRITNNVLLENLVSKKILTSVLKSKSLVTVDELTWEAATVLFSGAYLWVGVQTWHVLQEMWVGVNILWLLDYNFAIDVSAKEKMQRTGKLIVALDQKPGTLYESFVKAKLFDAWLIHVYVEFLYPRYEKLTTILDDYKLEQVQFDANHIAHRIHEDLEN